MLLLLPHPVRHCPLVFAVCTKFNLLPSDDYAGAQVFSCNQDIAVQEKLLEQVAQNKSRGKGSRGSERQQTALKQIQAFGDFSFKTSSGSNTRNAGALSKSAAVVVKPPAAKAKLVAAAKTKQQSPKPKPPPSLPPQQLPKKGTTTKSNQVVVAAAGTGRGGKAQRSCGGSIPIVSTAEKMLQDEMKETAKEVRREKEEWKREREDAKREREQAKREREQLKREREEFEKAQKQAPPQRKLGIVFIILVLILYDS